LPESRADNHGLTRTMATATVATAAKAATVASATATVSACVLRK